MQPVKENTSSFNQRMAREFPGVFRVDKSVLFSLICDYEIRAKQKSQVTQHLNSAHHIKCVGPQTIDPNKVNQTLLTTLNENTDRNRHASALAVHLRTTCSKTNIPPHTIRNPAMVEFLEKHTKYAALYDKKTERFLCSSGFRGSKECEIGSKVYCSH